MRGNTKLANLFQIFAAACFLSACATTKKYEEILGSWITEPESELIAAWGMPESEYPHPYKKGWKVMQYRSSRLIQFGGYKYLEPQAVHHRGTVTVDGNGGRSTTGDYSGTSTTYVEKQAPVSYYEKVCVTRFIIDNKGIVEDWEHQGDDCTSK